MEKVCNRPGNTNKRQRREADLGAAHKVSEQACADRGVLRGLFGRAELAKEEHGADAFENCDTCKVGCMQVIDDRLDAVIASDQGLNALCGNSTSAAYYRCDDEPEEWHKYAFVLSG